MSTKMTIALALAAGFIGGTISQRIVPTVVQAQQQAAMPQEIRAHKFVLVDDSGVDRGVFGFAAFKKWGLNPTIELMEPKGHIWSFRPAGYSLQGMLLPDATCQTCVRNPAKKDSAPPSNGTISK